MRCQGPRTHLFFKNNKKHRTLDSNEATAHRRGGQLTVQTPYNPESVEAANSNGAIHPLSKYSSTQPRRTHIPHSPMHSSHFFHW